MPDRELATPDPRSFPETRWSLLARFKAGEEEALASFCETYWLPVFGYIRRWGRGRHDAEDLTQEFLVRLMERDILGETREEKGKLRSFLLVLLKRFLADDHDYRTAAKRGGKATRIPIDVRQAERLFGGELASMSTPERFFDRQWALALLEAVLTDLGTEYERSGKARIFGALRGSLSMVSAGPEGTYAEIAVRLGMTENAIKIAAYRLRQRYRQLLHQRILETVESPEDVKEEIEYLCSVLGD